MSKAINMDVGKKIIIRKGIPLQSVTHDKVRSIHTVLYESEDGDFLNNANEKVTILNEYNSTTNCSRTIALFTNKNNHSINVKTSDRITQLIGQKNYDILLAAICSIISIELKIRGIISLLTEPNKSDSSIKVEKVDKEVQTEIEQKTEMNIKEPLKRKRVRQTFCPYPVLNEAQIGIKKVVVNPEDVLSKRFKIENVKSPDPITADSDKTPDSIRYPEIKLLNEEPLAGTTKTFTDLCDAFDEVSNLSYKSADDISLSKFSLTSEVENPSLLLGVIDKCTENFNKYITETDSINSPCNLVLYDGSTIDLPTTPEDDFHLVTSEILKSLSKETGKKLLLHQLLIDFKHCLDQDEDNNLPLHDAVMNNDVDFLKRQCIVLKKKQESVDFPGMDNMSALHMAIKRKSLECSTILLQYGACPLHEDNESKTALHLAAEYDCGPIVEAIISHCRKYPREIMEENDMWLQLEKYKNTSKEILAAGLLYIITMACDCHGYTPLMMASNKGHFEVVKLLVQVCGNSINMPSPNSGDTALFIAVGAACLDSKRRHNTSTITENYSKTIKTLLENGADPSISNKSGNNITTLLSEFTNNDLSLLIANTWTSVKYFDGKIPANVTGMEKYMLLKDGAKILPYTKRTNDMKNDKRVTNETNTKRRPTILKKQSLKKVNADSLISTKKKFTLKCQTDSVTKDESNIKIIQNIPVKIPAKLNKRK